MNSKVALVKCADYDSGMVIAAVKRAVDLIGGIQVFIKPSSKVLVKPNLLIAKEPEFGITTHPEVVRATIKVLKEINCDICVGDSPSAWGNQEIALEELYSRTGMKELCRQEDVRLVAFNKKHWKNEFPLTNWLMETDYLVNIPKFKTHQITFLSGAVKNIFGLIPGSYKAQLHKFHFTPEEFSRMLVDLYAQVRPSLNILDGITAIEGDGPGTSGRLRNAGLVLASSDAVALDSVLALIMGVEPGSILTNSQAAQRGLGSNDLKDILILGESIDNSRLKSFQFPSVPLLQKKGVSPFLKPVLKYIKCYPYCIHQKCTRCLSCVEICPQKVISIRKNRIVFDYKGCISCFCCQESCPFSALKVKKSLLAKIAGL
ncbi:MAG: DUF362 domain-containing protein [Candidatus Omnitrophota bacterium]